MVPDPDYGASLLVVVVAAAAVTVAVVVVEVVARDVDGGSDRDADSGGDDDGDATTMNDFRCCCTWNWHRCWKRYPDPHPPWTKGALSG